MKKKSEGENQNAKEGGGEKMTVEKARELSSEEFALLDKQYGGFNEERYNNHQAHERTETFYDFIEKGSKRIKGIQLFKKIN